MKKLVEKVLVVVLAVSLAMPLPALATRIKDISSVGGMRANQLIGYGLVVGLKNTGDRSYKTPFTIQTLLSMLKRLGTTVDIRQLTGQNIGVSDTRQLKDVRVENVAAVMITASLPPYAKPGQRVDVSVSSLGDARSLEGGTLLLTPLKAANGQVYAVAQGKLPEKDLEDKSQRGRKYKTVGTIENGAIVEKGIDVNFEAKKEFQLILHDPDFSTAQSLVTAVNTMYGENTAKGIDAGTVELKLPQGFENNPFGFISEVETLEVKKDSVAKVVLDGKTGTVVIGENVEINSVAISYGDITIRVRSLGAGEAVAEKRDSLNIISANADINELVKALNALGVSPQDLVAIFRSIRSAGALNAELEIL